MQIAGVVLSLMTAACWAVSPMCFASAGRRIGSLHVVVLRSMLAGLLLLALLPAYALIVGGWPGTPRGVQVLWLVVSAMAGMVVGDVLIYESLVLLGVRRTTQIQTLAPVASVLLGWAWLGERLAPGTLGGIALVVAGTSYAVLRRPTVEGASHEPGQVSAAGVLCAAGGAVCVGIGAVSVRRAYGLGPLDAMLATVIRVNSAAVLLWLAPIWRRHGRETMGYLRDRFVLSRVLPGTFAGPVTGMLCYLVALKHLEAGPVSTLTSMSPLFVLPMIAVRYRVRIGADVVAASAVALGGVGLICLR